MQFRAQSPVPTQVHTQSSIAVTPTRHPHAPELVPLKNEIIEQESELELQEEDILDTARNCFETREFLRAAQLLQACKSSKARFIRIYSQFIVSFPIRLIIGSFKHTLHKASERKAQREWHKLDSRSMNVESFDIFLSSARQSTPTTCCGESFAK